MYQDSGATATAAMCSFQSPGVTSSQDPFFIRLGEWSSSMDHQLGEFIVYDRALDNAERMAVMAYLAEKWGL